MAETAMDSCIEAFNDHPQTAHGDVVAVLRRKRENIVAGQIKLRPPGTVTPTFRWYEPRKRALRGEWPRIWRKLFCWS